MRFPYPRQVAPEYIAGPETYAGGVGWRRRHTWRALWYKLNRIERRGGWIYLSDFSDRQWRDRRSGGPSLLRIVLRLVFALAFLWLGGLIAYTAGLPQQAAAPARTTDGIVVLTGGADRLDAGLKLLIDGKAKKLLISGVDPATTAAMLQARNTQAPELFGCCVELGHQAQDTVGNAFEAALWAERERYRSLHIVTAAYHMPRSLLLFREAMPEVEVIANPVFPAHVKLQRWWLYPGTARLLALEYSKYLVSLVRVRLSGSVE